MNEHQEDLNVDVSHSLKKILLLDVDYKILWTFRGGRGENRGETMSRYSWTSTRGYRAYVILISWTPGSADRADGGAGRKVLGRWWEVREAVCLL